ncbi:MAG: DEAD/DEAH box helicase family protein, partial [Phycisphaerae bacterium]|nr:DEAD/DEAH box helicase family protein [Phycisphaerae bacterium]
MPTVYLTNPPSAPPSRGVSPTTPPPTGRRPPLRSIVLPHSPFRVVAPFQPTGDQPGAIEALTGRLGRGERFACLLGATGTGKTFTMAHTIARLNKPTIILSHNKTLAAQLYEEM